MSKEDKPKLPGKGNPKKEDEKENFQGKDKGKFRKKGPRNQGFPSKNDPKFYTKFDNLAKVSAALAWNHRNGSVIDFSHGGSAYANNIDPIVTIQTIVTPGISESIDSGINMMSDTTFKMLNRRFRGVYGKYQSCDVGISQFALIDLFASIADLERAYGVMMKYKVNQRNIPYALMIALGIDPYSFGDLAQFRYELNRLILRAQSLCLIRGYSLLDHVLYIYSNIFKDKDDARSQYVAFTKEGYWRWYPTGFTTGSAVHFVPYTRSTRVTIGGFTSYLRTASDMLTDLENQINDLIHDDDIDQICSDLLAFYGNKEDNAEIVRLMAMPENYEVDAIFDVDVLKQIHNSTCMTVNFRDAVSNFWQTNLVTDFTNGLCGNTGLYVYQENNSIKFNISGVWGTTASTVQGASQQCVFGSTDLIERVISKALLDTDVIDPDYKHNLEISRYTVLTEQETAVISGTTYYRNKVVACGTILPLTLSVLVLDVPNAITSYVPVTGQPYKFDMVISAGHYDLQSNVGVTAIHDVTCISKLDWAPILYLGSATGAGGYPVGDLDNYISLDKSLLQPIHDVANLSEFSNPIGEFLLKD